MLKYFTVRRMGPVQDCVWSVAFVNNEDLAMGGIGAARVRRFVNRPVATLDFIRKLEGEGFVRHTAGQGNKTAFYVSQLEAKPEDPANYVMNPTGVYL